MATIRYKGKTTVTTPVRSRGTSGSDASSARIASERASSGAVSMTGERNESAAQRKARLGIMDTPDGGTTEIDTAQPSPQDWDAETYQNFKKANPTLEPTQEDTNIMKGMVPYDQALKGLQQSGQSAKDIAGGTTALQNAYKTGQAQLAGTPVPADPGQAMTQVQGAMPPPTPDMSATDLALKEDVGFQNLISQYNEYFSPDKQKVTLMDTYNKLFKKSGLDQLDEEIIDAQTIIDGTEDDIRNEIEQAGGFGTDSQVQALSLSRNKVLLKNYNNLVALRESKATQLETMIDLADKDRTYASGQFDTMMKFQDKMLDYRDKFIQNARDQYNKYDPAQLNAMLAGNPRQLAFAEDIMGLGRGGLAKLASAPLSEMDSLKLENAKLQNQKLRQDISGAGGTGAGTISGKPQNATQATANSYANRMAEANITLNNLGSKFTGKLSQLPAFNFMKSSDRQVYEQAQKNFVTAVLRRESGASIAPSEFDTARDVYFPKPGDTPEVVANKAQTRNTVINNFYREANVLRPVNIGDIIQGDDGQNYKVGADGETLEKI